MTIALDHENNATICKCDRCGTSEETPTASGRVPETWGTGQLWIDTGIASQRQIALCFCPDCFEVILGGIAGSGLSVQEIA